MAVKIISKTLGFEWDSKNSEKNHQKHGVSYYECEQVFFNRLLFIHEDSQNEQYSRCLGHTNEGRKLFVAFAIRKNLIRIISARDMHIKERRLYEKIKKNA